MTGRPVLVAETWRLLARLLFQHWGDAASRVSTNYSLKSAKTFFPPQCWNANAEFRRIAGDIERELHQQIFGCWDAAAVRSVERATLNEQATRVASRDSR